MERFIGVIEPVEKLPKLDKKDTIIISALMKNCRLQVSTLAKIVRLSKNSVKNRMERLEESGIIRDYMTYVDILKLTHKMGAIFLKTNLLYVETVDYLKYLAKIPFVMNAINTSGEYNFLVFFYYKDDQHLNKTITDILSKSHANDFKILKINKINFTELNLTSQEVDITSKLKKDDYSYFKLFSRKETEIKYDKKDIDLLFLLAHNARGSLTYLSKKLDLNRETVNYRMKKLINGGIIKKFQPNVNPYLLGRQLYIFRLKMLDRTRTSDVIQFLSATKKCNNILESFEEWNLIAFLHSSNIEEMRKIETSLMEHFGDDILESNLDIGKVQSKLDWFPHEVAEDIKRSL